MVPAVDQGQHDGSADNDNAEPGVDAEMATALQIRHQVCHADVPILIDHDPEAGVEIGLGEIRGLEPRRGDCEVSHRDVDPLLAQQLQQLRDRAHLLHVIGQLEIAGDLLPKLPGEASIAIARFHDEGRREVNCSLYRCRCPLCRNMRRTTREEHQYDDQPDEHKHHQLLHRRCYAIRTDFPSSLPASSGERRISARAKRSSRSRKNSIMAARVEHPRRRFHNARTGNPGFSSCFAHLRRPSLRRSEHNVPIPLHAHDGDAVVLSLVERLGQRAQPELSVVGCLPGGVVMVEKQREPWP